MSKEARSSRCEVRTTTTLVRNVSPSGHKTLNEYRILAELGRGCHGKVKLAQDTKTQSLWALKVVPRLERRVNKLQSSTDGHLRAIRREIAILKKCVHTHVVRLREVIDDPQAEKIYMGILLLTQSWSTAREATLCGTRTRRPSCQSCRRSTFSSMLS